MQADYQSSAALALQDVSPCTQIRCSLCNQQKYKSSVLASHKALNRSSRTVQNMISSFDLVQSMRMRAVGQQNNSYSFMYPATCAIFPLHQKLFYSEIGKHLLSASLHELDP